MQSNQKPSKENVRNYLQQRIEKKLPPPSIEEIRRVLGWGLKEQKTK